MALKILLADDHKLTLEGVRRTLSDSGGFEVVATATSGKEALELVAETRPDIAVLDIRMPDLDGLGCLDAIRERHPGVKVVMLSSFTEQSQVNDALDRGAAAYVVKSVNPIDLPAVLRQAFERTVFYARSDATRVPRRGRSEAPNPELTDREVTILKALGRGLTNRGIAKDLWVTEQTVKFHLNNIYRKLGVQNRTAALRYAFDHGLVEDDEPALQTG